MKKFPDILKAIIISLIFVITFSLYLYFVGIPMTRARNLTNEAVRLIDEEEYDEALKRLEEANMVQKTDERDNLIEQVKEKLN